MLIVSPDKLSIFNIDNVSSIYVTEDFGISICMKSDEYIKFRKTYENESHAKSIIRKITDAYANNEKVFFMPEE